MPTKTAPIKKSQTKKSKSQRTSTKKSGKGKKSNKKIGTKQPASPTLNSQKAKKATRSQQSKTSKPRGKASAKKGKSKGKHVREKVHYNRAGDIIDYSINVDEYEVESLGEEESETSVISEGESIEISGDLTGVEVTHSEDSWTESTTYEQGADAGEDDDDNGTIWGGPQITGELSEGGDHE